MQRQNLKIFNATCIILLLTASTYIFLASSVEEDGLLKLDLRQGEQLTEKDIRWINTLKSIKKSCGQVCDTTIKGQPSKYFNQVKKKIECADLFTNENFDNLSEDDIPSTKIPSYMATEFSWNGIWKLENDYRDDSKGGHMTTWTIEHVNNERDKFERGELQGSYGKENVDEISRFLDHKLSVFDKRVLVIGSEVPWFEAVLLSKGAKKITTFDYVAIDSQHPQIEVITPEELEKKFFAGIRYDVMVTFSSIEHSGLGRYGDMLNPWGDLITMARAWCLLKPGSLALVGVPTGLDQIKFNSHKLYGERAYAQLFANWQLIDTNFKFSKFNETGCEFCYQPIHIVKKI